jgi:hypothetical protein
LVWFSGRLQPCLQILTRVEVKGRGKHFSLLRYGNNYCRKKLYSSGSGGGGGSFPSCQRKVGIIVKNLFSFPVFYFQLLECIYYKSYRQVLTSVDNLQCLLRPPIFDKTRFIAFHLECNKETRTTCIYQEEKSKSAHDLYSLLAVTNNNHS